MLILSRIALAVSVVGLSACASAPVPPKPKPDLTPRLSALPAPGRASFDCSGALPEVHRQICANDGLAAQDRELAAVLYNRLGSMDLPGALALEANQRQWLLGRAGTCGLGTEIGTAMPANLDAQACLASLYRQRLSELRNWPDPQAKSGAQRHAWASYAEFRIAEDLRPGLCTAVSAALNRSLATDGEANIQTLSGATLLAGSRLDQPAISAGGHHYRVELYNPGLYAGYQQRARGLLIDDRVVMDHRTMPAWIAKQPGYGGRANASSSQTSDYGSIDLFSYQGETLALVNETWGFYSPAARGESAYAGVYALGSDIQPLCLFQSYLTPPRTDNLRGLPTYAQLTAELDQLAGDPLPGYAQSERRDLFQRWKERQWTLLNLPLLGVDEYQRSGREAAVAARNDAAMEQFFQWSERNLGNKQRYRRLMPLLAPARQELHSMFVGQGLTDTEAATAADLLFHETFARSMENLQLPEQPPAMPLAPFARYQARYAIAPQPGALEQGRQFATLHSVVLNGAPLNVVADFVDYETDTLGSARGIGPDGDTALMAAVATPDTLSLLLQRGFDVNARNQWGRTALMTAAQHGEVESVRRLLAAGADLYAETRVAANAGVGGPDRKEAATGRQTALLLAASSGSEATIRALMDAGAMRQAWRGYDGQICRAMETNSSLSDSQRSTFKASELCASTYAPLPVSAQKVVDIRAGDELIIREDGQGYPIQLIRRPEMTLFGRPTEMPPQDLSTDIGSMAINVATTATRRAKVRVAGPLTLVFDDLSTNTPDLLRFQVSFPVSGAPLTQPGYRATSVPEQQVLSLNFDPQHHQVEAAWRALYGAAYTQGLKPAKTGYVVIDNRGARRISYQLVVTDQYEEQGN
ncbi:MAG: ankyrin repeat domain-containing protein [Pseudomonadaceae bacterium]